MNRTYQKNIRRTLASTRSRFLAIFSIVALGVGFLAGLVSTTPDMRDSIEQYLDDANLYDLRIIGTLGLTDADVQAVRQVDGVLDARDAWSADVLVKTPTSDQAVARVHSLPTDADGNPDGNSVINQLVLEDGRWPQASGECVVEAGAGDLASRGVNIGDTIEVPADDNEDLEDTLATTEYTVVGVVHDATYFSFEREPASVGSGAVETIFYILPQDFAYDTYTEIYLTVDGARDMNSLSDTYDDTVQAVKRSTTPGMNIMIPPPKRNRNCPMRHRNCRTAGMPWLTVSRKWLTASATTRTAWPNWQIMSSSSRMAKLP